LRAIITSVSPGQSQKIPSAERLASNARTSAAKSSRRSPNRCAPDDIEAALAAYEEALFPRSESEYADAYLILDLCLGDRAPFGLIDFLTGALEGEHEGAAQS
jgi:hypothetical protein